MGHPHAGTCPLTQRELLEEFFLEHRTKVLDLAAFLDRMDRSVSRDAEDDFRLRAFREAICALSSGEFGRVQAVQMILSDPTTEPLDGLDRKSAWGAYGREEGAE